MENILGLLIPVTFVLLIVLERVFPARPLPRVRGWLPKCLAFFVMTGVVSTVIPGAFVAVFGARAPLHLSGLGIVPSALIGVLVNDFLWYCTHRTLHRVPFLWRWTHQMHHSAERLDVAGSAYFHPLDVTVQSVLSSVPLLLLGLSADAAALAGFVGFLLGTFQHMNVRTPQWLGWIVQRPEAHSVHHARGLHAYNYGNIMLWDILLGTIRNPSGFNGQAGFWDGASARVGSMLIGRDVSEPSLAARPVEKSP